MREDGMGEREVRLLRELFKLKTARDHELRGLQFQKAPHELFFYSHLYQAIGAVESEIVTRMEIRNKLDAAAQRSAADVEQNVLGPQSHLDHEVSLETADFQPSSADEVAMACQPYSETAVRFSKCLERSRLQRVKRRCCWRTFHAHPLVERVDSRRHQRIR